MVNRKFPSQARMNFNRKLASDTGFSRCPSKCLKWDPKWPPRLLLKKRDVGIFSSKVFLFLLSSSWQITYRKHLVCTMAIMYGLVCNRTIMYGLAGNSTIMYHLVCSISIMYRLMCSMTIMYGLAGNSTIMYHLVCSISMYKMGCSMIFMYCLACSMTIMYLIQPIYTSLHFGWHRILNYFCAAPDFGKSLWFAPKWP